MVEQFCDEDCVAITSLKRFNGIIFCVQDEAFTLRFFRLETMVKSTEMTEHRKLVLYEIKQAVKASEESTDVYKGDNKLVELRDSSFGGTRRRNSTFIVSAVSSGHRVNLYVVEALISRSCTFTSCNKKYKLRHQALKVFKFPNAPTCCLELGDDRIAVGMGTQLKVLDIRSAKDTGIIFDGHLDRVRSIAKVSKNMRVKKKIKGKWKNSKQRHHFLISTGSDREIRVWMVPATVLAGKTVTIKNGIEVEQDGEEYCRLLIRSKHKEQINALLYTDDKVITASEDKSIKIYRIQSQDADPESSSEDDNTIIKTGFVDADLNPGNK